MYSLSVIILSYAIDEDIYRMNCQCLDSLFSSENWKVGELEVLLIESNKASKYQYRHNIKIIVPEEQFNFHRFLNIGLQNSVGNFIAFCNNDIVFTPGWFSAISKVKDGHPEFKCFSPLDRSYPLMGENSLPGTKDYYIGWDNKKHFAAWCFVWERTVFDIIGPFDEKFVFYSADDDELQTLRYYAIPNVVVTHSEVKHLSQVVTKKESAINPHKITDKEKYPLTEAEIKRGYSWLWDDDRFYYAYQQEKKKWGNSQMRQRVNRFLEKHKWLNRRCITKILYNRRVNILMAKLTGIKQ